MKNQIKKSMAFLICIVMTVASLVGCGAKSGGGGSVNGSGVKILMTLHDDTDTFLITLCETIDKRAQETGATIDTVYCQSDPEIQMQQIADAAGQGYDAIICRLADATTILQMEKAAGSLPIVFINNEPDVDYLKADKFVYVGSFEQDAGRFQAEYIWNGLGKPQSLNVIIMEGMKGHAAVPQRTNAVKYFFLALVVLVFNTCILRLLITAGLPYMLAKIITETLMFFFSWTVQKLFIFKEARS